MSLIRQFELLLVLKLQVISRLFNLLFHSFFLFNADYFLKERRAQQLLYMYDATRIQWKGRLRM